MAEDLKWELTILEVVQGFNLGLLGEVLGEAPLAPAELRSEALRATPLPEAVSLMRRWMKLLDLAIPIDKLRATLANDPDQDLAEALLRYFAVKRSSLDGDRDKTDFLATFLYRHPRVAGQWETHGYSLDGEAPTSPFEIALLEIFGEEFEDLPAAHERLLEDLQQMRDQVADVRSFDELVDADFLQRARQLKADLGGCFYHPHALAAVAAYNAHFSQRFDDLFGRAAQTIKNFAIDRQQDGERAGAKVLGNYTLRQLAEVREERILGLEYTRAQDQLRHVAHLKKAVERRTQPAPPPRREAPTVGYAAASGYAAPAPRVMPPTPPLMPPGVSSAPGAPVHARISPSVGLAGAELSHGAAAAPSSISASGEMTRLKSVEESIRAFVRAANPQLRQIVPMKFGNLALSPGEADAFCADVLNEKSFRADNARALTHVVSVVARVSGEMAELQKKQGSTYLWKPHADSIVHLMDYARELTLEASRVMNTAQQRGLIEKVNILTASLQKMQEKLAQASLMIRALSSKMEL